MSAPGCATSNKADRNERDSRIETTGLRPVHPSQALVYIAGYGRSGSTLLDTLLGNHPSIFGAGELSWLFRDYLRNADCSCGLPMQTCRIWKGVLDIVLDEIPGLTCARAHEITVSRENLLRRGQNDAAHGELWNVTLNAMRTVTGKPIIVDSSKTDRVSLRRLPLFARHLDSHVLGIHLIRDPRAVMWSAMRGSNRRLEQGAQQRKRRHPLHTLLSWSFSNVVAEWQSLRHLPEGMLRIRYQDLILAPEQILTQIGEFIGVNPAPVVNAAVRDDPVSAGHGIAGNRMRRSGPIILRLDDEWKGRLPMTARLYSLLALPLMCRYRVSQVSGRHSA